eukprot:scaffold17244_cov55-Attheya_sp.AAC.7
MDIIGLSQAIDAGSYQYTDVNTIGAASILQLFCKSLAKSTFFRGGELTKAEACIQGDTEKWNSIPSKRGKFMSLIVKANDISVYSELLEKLDNIYNGKLDVRPIQSSATKKHFHTKV